MRLASFLVVSRDLMPLPREQGLKQEKLKRKDSCGARFDAPSKRTRIETMWTFGADLNN